MKKFKKKKQVLDHKNFAPMLNAFTQFATDKLGIQMPPNIQLSKDELETSFGGYSPMDHSIIVVSKNRHPMDVFRTLAHELVHHKQKEDGKIGKDISQEGATGSPQENEANAVAGQLLRWYAKANPEMFRLGYVTEEVLNEAATGSSARHKAIIVTGAPGAGKSAIFNPEQHGLIQVDANQLYDHVANKKRPPQAIADRRGIAINIVGDEPAYVSTLGNGLSNLGYETMLLNVSVNNAVSRKRNIVRGMRGGQTIPENTRQQRWMGVQAAQPVYKQLFGKNYITISNNEDLNKAKPERAKEIQARRDNLFSTVRGFVSTPANNPIANAWKQKELRRLGILNDKPPEDAGFNMTTPINQSLRLVAEDLRDWFGKGKQGGVGGGGWDRYSSSGERLGKCAREPGEPKPKCLSKGKAQALRRKGGKNAIASVVNAKRKEDPVADRSGKGGKPVFSRAVAKKLQKEESMYLEEKNNPTNPKLWSKAKALARQKFDVYPSAYANGWAAKWYKSKGGGWKSVNENVDKNIDLNDRFQSYINDPGKREWGKTSTADLYKHMTPGQGVQKEAMTNSTPDTSNLGGASLTRGTLPTQDGIGPETTVYRPMTVSGYGDAYSIGESVAKWASKKSTQKRFVEKYGKDAQKKLHETCVRLSQAFNEEAEVGGASYGKDPADTMGMIGTQNKDDVRENKMTFRRKKIEEGAEYSQKELTDMALQAGFKSEGGTKHRKYYHSDGRVVLIPGHKNLNPYTVKGIVATIRNKGTRAAMQIANRRTAEISEDSEMAIMPRGYLNKFKFVKGDPAKEHQYARQRRIKQKTAQNYQAQHSIRKAVGGPKEKRAERLAAGKTIMNEAKITDLGQKRDEKKLKTFHKGFMSDIADRAKAMGELIQSHKEAGRFPMDVGTRFSTSHSRRTKQAPFEVTGYYVNPRNPEGDYGYHVKRKDAEGNEEQTQHAIRSPGLEKIHGPEKWAQLQADVQQFKPLKSLKESAAWQRSAGKDPEGGLNRKGVESYRREHPGSKLQTAVTTEPSKLKAGSKKAKRRLSFCRRMKGMKAKLTSAETARDPDSRINKSLRKWNCEE